MKKILLSLTVELADVIDGMRNGQARNPLIEQLLRTHPQVKREINRKKARLPDRSPHGDPARWGPRKKKK